MCVKLDFILINKLTFSSVLAVCLPGTMGTDSSGCCWWSLIWKHRNEGGLTKRKKEEGPDWAV